MRFKKEWLNLLLIIGLFVNAWLPVHASTGSTENTSVVRPPASPAKQGTCPGFWHYPVAVTDPGGSNIGGSTFTSLSPERVLGSEDNQGGGGRISWGSLPGGQTWVQGVFDLGAIITLDTNCTITGSNVEAQTHSLSISGAFNWGTPRLQVSSSPTGPWSTRSFINVTCLILYHPPLAPGVPCFPGLLILKLHTRNRPGRPALMWDRSGMFGCWMGVGTS